MMPVSYPPMREVCSGILFRRKPILACRFSRMHFSISHSTQPHPHRCPGTFPNRNNGNIRVFNTRRHSLQKAVYPRISRVYKMKMPPALLRYHEPQPPTSVQLAFAEQFPTGRTARIARSASISTTRNLPLMEYRQRINGVYDSINLQKDLQKYHALSLRCYRRSFFLNGKDDGYAAYIVLTGHWPICRTVSRIKAIGLSGGEQKNKIYGCDPIRYRCPGVYRAKLQAILWAF